MRNKGKNKIAMYCALHILYWLPFATLVGFATVYLLNRGFTATEVGIVFALANILASIMQPIVADYTDKHEGLSINFLIAIISIIIFVLGILLLILSSKPAVQLLYTLMVALILVILPLVNTAGMVLKARGNKVDYGLARAFGSLTFATVTITTGNLIIKFGESIIIFMTVIALTIFILFLFRTEPIRLISNHEREEALEAPLELRDFFAHYKGFLAFLIGVICVFTFHNLTNTYLLQMMEHVGGNASDMGFALALAAFFELPGMMGFTWIMRRIRTDNIIRITTVFWLIKATLFFFATSIFNVNVAQSLSAVSFALYIPASAYFADKVIKDSDKVKGQAFLTTAGTVGAVLGNFLGGVIADNLGIPMMLLTGIGFTLAGLIFINLGLNTINKWAGQSMEIKG